MGQWNVCHLHGGSNCVLLQVTSGCIHRRQPTENAEGLVHFEHWWRQAPYSATSPQKLGGLGSIDNSPVRVWCEAPAAHGFFCGTVKHILRHKMHEIVLHANYWGELVTDVLRPKY